MPLFTYICPNSHEHNAVADSGKLPRVCPECGEPACRLFKPHRVNAFTPYVTDAGSDTPTEIRTARQEDAYCKEHHVDRMLDSEQFDSAKSARRRQERSKTILEQETWEESCQAVDKISLNEEPAAPALSGNSS